jgi:hypothetical protein
MPRMQANPCLHSQIGLPRLLAQPLSPSRGPKEAAEPPLYVHKITVDRAYGEELNPERLNWAGTKAADEGADWLRVDVWTTNERLHHYYLRQCFTHVRTVVLPTTLRALSSDRPSGCQHRAGKRLGPDWLIRTI